MENLTAFWPIFAAVLSANLLTVGFVWAMWNLSRLEREGAYHLPGQGKGLYLSFALMVMLFALAGWWIVASQPKAKVVAAPAAAASNAPLLDFNVR